MDRTCELANPFVSIEPIASLMTLLNDIFSKSYVCYDDIKK